MKTRDLFEKTKKEAINNEIARLQTYKSYKEGLRDAEKQANVYYEQIKRSVNQQRWFKIIKQDNLPLIAWSQNNSITMVFYADGNYKFSDEIDGKTNYCRVVGASKNADTHFYGTIKELIEAVKNDNFTHKKNNLLAPVEHFIN